VFKSPALRELSSKIIGTWTTKSTFDGEVLEGEEEWVWSSDNERINFHGYTFEGGKKIVYGGVMGWDGDQGHRAPRTWSREIALAKIEANYSRGGRETVSSGCSELPLYSWR
jgi:hypothetical protein